MDSPTNGDDDIVSSIRVQIRLVVTSDDHIQGCGNADDLNGSNVMMLYMVEKGATRCMVTRETIL